jgi:SAM-dependent methyltransferase
VSIEEVSDKNSQFWNELCGTHLAKSLGIADSSPASLKKFDDWYFDIYPYLFDHIPFGELQGKDVLEVGLGYGTVAQKIAESGANYSGLDIAAGPAEMANHRLQQAGLSGRAVQGSILNPPFPAESFDVIVAIGCLHHTGDLQLAINNCWKLLRPGGSLIFMVYYAYSYRRYCTCLSATLGYSLREISGYRGVIGGSASQERAAYDANADGASAPHTDWISVRSMKALCRDFTKFSSRIENISQELIFRAVPREKLLPTPLPQFLGLDLYAKATK